MDQRLHDASGWFDLAMCVRREGRRRQLRAVLVRPVRGLSIRMSRILIALLIVTGLLKASLIEAFFVPSSSMRPTLRENDYILVPKFLYGLHIPLLKETVVKWSNPDRGDVIVFQLNATNGDSQTNEALVKRVVGIEGDLVEIIGRKVLVNGTPLLEPYADWGAGVGEGTHHFGPYRVPVETVFVLGDNRDNSEDSRYWRDPFVPLSQVVGKAFMVYWSGGQNNRAGIVL